MVVDDQAMVLNFLKVFTSRLGFETITARDGEEAWEQFQSTAPDLVITDLRMPRMNGVELATRIRDLSIMPPIIVLTGSFADAICSDLEHLRNVHVAQKPINTRDFTELIHELVGVPS
jgi:DNA-binding response OmpR family regulator